MERKHYEKDAVFSVGRYGLSQSLKMTDMTIWDIIEALRNVMKTMMDAPAVLDD